MQFELRIQSEKQKPANFICTISFETSQIWKEKEIKKMK